MRNARHRAIGFRLNALHRTLERSFHFIQHLNAIRIHDVTDQFHPTHIQFYRCHFPFSSLVSWHKCNDK